MKWNAFHTDLRETLAGLFYTRDSSQPVIVDAGLPVSRITWHHNPTILWQSAIEAAIAHGRVAELVDKAAAVAPRDPGLIAAKAGRMVRARGGDMDWQAPSDASTLEKIIGEESQLLPIAFLKVGAQRARAVCRIRRSDNVVGTGFLINDDLLVTNHHVLPDAETASAAIAEFNYEGSYDGLEVEKDPRELDPHTFWTSVGDDLAVVRVNGAPGKVYGAITVGDATVAVGARIAIIQHAGGQAKQVAMGHNAVVFSSTKCVQYLTDTLGGSSGSPVFDREWRLVAVHHAGGWLHEAGSKGRYYRNEGIPVAVLRAGLVTARLLP